MEQFDSELGGMWVEKSAKQRLDLISMTLSLVCVILYTMAWGWGGKPGWETVIALFLTTILAGISYYTVDRWRPFFLICGLFFLAATVQSFLAL